jgi:hypothetical protein
MVLNGYFWPLGNDSVNNGSIFRSCVPSSAEAESNCSDFAADALGGEHLICLSHDLAVQRTPFG